MCFHLLTSIWVLSMVVTIYYLPGLAQRNNSMRSKGRTPAECSWAKLVINLALRNIISGSCRRGRAVALPS